MSSPRSKPKQTNAHAHAPLNRQQLASVADLFATLSEPSRLRILQVLQNGPASVTEVIQQTGFKQANASKQLGILHTAGVIDRRQDGNCAIYSIAMPLVFEICELVCDRIARKTAAYAAELSRTKAVTAD